MNAFRLNRGSYYLLKQSVSCAGWARGRVPPRSRSLLVPRASRAWFPGPPERGSLAQNAKIEKNALALLVVKKKCFGILSCQQMLFHS